MTPSAVAYETSKRTIDDHSAHAKQCKFGITFCEMVVESFVGQGYEPVGRGHEVTVNGTWKVRARSAHQKR